MLLQRPLSDFEPRWLGGGAGVSFRCPGHPACGQRLPFYFDNPHDDAPRSAQGPYVHRLGEELADLTLASLPDEGEPLWVERHWRGWVLHGLVVSSLSGAW